MRGVKTEGEMATVGADMYKDAYASRSSDGSGRKTRSGSPGVDFEGHDRSVEVTGDLGSRTAAGAEGMVLHGVGSMRRSAESGHNAAEASRFKRDKARFGEGKSDLSDVECVVCKVVLGKGRLALKL